MFQGVVGLRGSSRFLRDLVKLPRPDPTLGILYYVKSLIIPHLPKRKYSQPPGDAPTPYPGVNIDWCINERAILARTTLTNSS